MSDRKTVVLVFGASGRTGQHFVATALQNGCAVKALLRNPSDLKVIHPDLEIHQGSTGDFDKAGLLLEGVDAVAVMLGNAQLQRHEDICTELVKKLVPAMRRHGVRRLVYQAGGFTRPYAKRLPFASWLLKNTLARYGGLLGQHRDNEAVLKYLTEEALDVDWVVHRASIISNGPSKGVLRRSTSKSSLATFADCATYNYSLLSDASAVHTSDLSCYASKVL